MSELEALQRKETWTDEDRKRFYELTRSNIKKTTFKKLSKIVSPSVGKQLDKIQDLFGGDVEPWTKFNCSECGDRYHLVDGSACECGKYESIRRFKKYLGEVPNGTKKA